MDMQSERSALWTVIILLILWIFHLQSTVPNKTEMHAYVDTAVSTLETKVTEVESTADDAKEKADDLEPKVEELEADL